MLGVEQDTETPEDPQANDTCVHSSDEDEEEEAQEEERQDGEATESPPATHDCSGSIPLLLDSEDEEEQGAQLIIHSSPQPSIEPSPNIFQQNVASTFAPNPSQNDTEPPKGADVTADVFSKAPFRTVQEEASDIFANAPFPLAAQQLDVFSQAPFAKKKETTGAQSKSTYPNAAGVHAVTPEQGVLGQVTSQPFRPQALAKYSRHFEGPALPQPVANNTVVSNVSQQTTVGSVPVGPLHSWNSEVSAVDPFVSAPFHLKASQEKP